MLQILQIQTISKISNWTVTKIRGNLLKSIDFVNKMKYNEYTNIDKLIYQIN